MFNNNAKSLMKLRIDMWFHWENESLIKENANFNTELQHNIVFKLTFFRYFPT
jgi:hypothetical protein